MRFAKLVDNIQISLPDIVVNYEVYIDEFSGSWKWFNEEILMEFKTLLKPRIIDCYWNQNKCFNDGNSSSVEFLNSPSIQVAYFFRKKPTSLNPCLIKCEKDKKYKPVNVSCINLVASMCKYTDSSMIGTRNSILLSELRKYLGKVASEPVTIRSYFEKKKPKTEVNLETLETEFQQPLKNIQVTSDEINNRHVSNSYSLVTASPVDDCERIAKENRLSICSIEKAGKRCNLSPEINSPSTYDFNYVRQRSKAAANTNDNEKFSSYHQNMVEIFGDDALEMETEDQDEIENDCVKSAAEAMEIIAVSADSNKRKLAVSELAMEKFNNVLSELEKTDPVIERLIVNSKSAPNCKNKKIAPVFTNGVHSQEDSVVAPKKGLKNNRRSAPRKNGGSKVAKSGKCKMTLRSKKPQQPQMSPILKHFQKSPVVGDKGKDDNESVIIENANAVSDSDDDLPPAFDDDDECQPSREDILQNLNQLQKSKGKENEEVVLDNNDDDDDDDLPEFSDCNKCIQSPIPKESLQISDLKTGGEIQNLTNEHIDFLMKENKRYFKDIIKGKIYSHRHDDFIKGGRARRDLMGQVFLSMYTDGQVEFILERLLDMFCNHSPKLNDYVFKVLLTEVLIKIIMDCKDLPYNEAERTLFYAGFTKD